MGWKDILRPIRDGLRDNLPERKPDHDDDSERRRRQRDDDVLKGFAYFETFADLERWTPESVDALQRANTPLLRRAPAAVGNDKNKAKVVLIHDYSGNYHGYESCQGHSSAEESYSCGYMQFVDSFVYFSHKLVCIPPPTWTNSLHRNGVKSYGTFLVEPQTPDIARILQRTARSEVPGSWEYPIASRLADMAKHYGFDGWLLNLEKTFPLSQWSRERLSGFIVQLSSSLGKDNVVWYDALTVHNTLQYQNSLSKSNGLFAQAAGSILTNYDWTAEKALVAKQLALELGIEPGNVMFGIDVWAQSSQLQGPQRRTYGGGGTSTGVAVELLARLGLTAGIFAPAWAFEHFPEFSKAVERSMWDGDQLPTSLRCDCRPESKHEAPEYLKYSITGSAMEYAAGSESFFHSNFARAFTTHTLGGNDPITSHLGKQSILPHLKGAGSIPYDDRGGFHGEFLSSPSRLAVSFKEAASSHLTPDRSLALFKLSMVGNLEARVTYRKEETPEGMNISFRFSGAEESSISVPSAACEKVTILRTFELAGHDPMDLATSQYLKRLTGVYLCISSNRFALEDATSIPVVEILEICIKKMGKYYRGPTIDGICIDAPANAHRRLRWCFEAKQGPASKEDHSDDGMPYSNITGPFAFFIVKVNGAISGRAYALEYLLTEEEGHKIDEEGDTEIEVVGYGFDERELCTCTCLARDIRRREGNGTGSWQLLQTVGSCSDVTMQSVSCD